MREAKSIDEIYAEVRDCDLVITNDAALATALNKMVDRPVVGSFAVTPQHIAAMVSAETLGEEACGELRTAQIVAEETGLDFKYVHGQIQYIREVRRFTQDVGKHMHTKDAKAVYRSYRAVPTLERCMESFNPEGSWFCGMHRKVAVVGLDAGRRFEDDVPIFNDLDKHFVPNDFIDVGIYKDVDYSPTVYESGNDRQLAEDAVALIDPASAEDYAIVLNAESPLADSVRTAMYRRGIPFVNDLVARDVNEVRDYLNFIKLSLSYETLRVSDVREMFSSLGGWVSPKTDGHLLSKARLDKESDEIRGYMRDIRSRTFGDVIVKYHRKSGTLDLILNDIGLYDSVISKSLFSRLEYAIENVTDLRHKEPVPESERRGVLLADCRASMYIDRPVVIYAGMGNDWDLDLSDRRYVEDITTENLKNAVRTEVLLQQGQRRFYLINSSKNGRVAMPCGTFDIIEMRPIEKFSDVFRKDRIEPACWAVSRGRETRVPEHPRCGSEPYGKEFSKSSYSKYLQCPRSFMFNVLVGSKDKDVLEFGNVLHDYAEFYVCYKDLAREKGLDFFLDAASDRYSGLSSSLMSDFDRQRLRCGMIRIEKIIDSRCVEAPLDEDVSDDDWQKNMFFEMFDPPLRRKSSVCECELRSEKYPLIGRFDLCTSDAIFDYKSGKPKSGGDIAKNMTSQVDKYTDHQALIYMAIASELGLSKEEFDLFFVMENEACYQDEDYDLSQNIRKVSVCDLSDREFCGLEATVSLYISKNRSKKIDDGHRFINIIVGGGADDCRLWPDDALLAEQVKAVFGTDKETSINAIKLMSKIVQSGIVWTDTEVIVRRPIMDTFLEKVKEDHAAMMEQSVTGFPCDHKIKCTDCDFRSLCTFNSISTEGDDDE